MSEQVPEYYQHLSASADGPSGETRHGAPAEESGGSEEDPRSQGYRADSFRLTLPASVWTDETVYSFTGPTVDGWRHTITVTSTQEPDADSPAAFWEQEREGLESALDGWRVLMEGALPLTCGHPAHRVIARWTQGADQTVYQEQLYTLHQEKGYILTAGFTDQSRRQIGARIEHIMRSFRPDDHGGESDHL